MKETLTFTEGSPNLVVSYSLEAEQNEPMVSLFDFLGSRAGLDLGGEVYKAAKQSNIFTSSKTIHNNCYQGKVTTYPHSFLKLFFLTKEEGIDVITFLNILNKFHE
jgi:hypothetical protein